ncbi:hypothetical protein HUG10_20745 (plasmid) [Halorarum halophilum]|uniref:Uncharacterized protein n=1 Tax=Halorarum halophilum TaxID=2743090 RepID=A0A7D5KGS0_9EURY|nr:hypothetical protein [Halobaculum halophilum]QLG30037.1 hypothetical protein HUG10_20745 [Halobaculum halophilum]
MGEESPEVADDAPSSNELRWEDVADNYETKEEFLDREFVGPDDFHEGAEVPEWWSFEGEAEDYEWAEQVDENTIRYLYRGYPVELRRTGVAMFESRIDTNGDYDYNDVEYLQLNHTMPIPSRISGAFNGKVVIETHQFEQYHAEKAVETFVDEEIDVKEGQEQLGEALQSFDS